MSNDIKGLVEFSRNLGVAKTEGDKIILTRSARSSLEEQLALSIRELHALSSLTGGECRISRRLGGTLGNCMSLTVHEYDELATPMQPLLSDMKIIRELIKA